MENILYKFENMFYHGLLLDQLLKEELYNLQLYVWIFMSPFMYIFKLCYLVYDLKILSCRIDSL